VDGGFRGHPVAERWLLGAFAANGCRTAAFFARYCTSYEQVHPERRISRFGLVEGMVGAASRNARPTRATLGQVQLGLEVVAPDGAVRTGLVLVRR